MNFLKYKIMSFLFLGFVAIHASDEDLRNNLSAMSMQDSATDESVRNDVGDDTPDIEVDIQKDFVINKGRVSNYPIKPNFSNKKYTREDLISRSNLARTMMYVFNDLVEPEDGLDHWLPEINSTNTLFMDLQMQGRILPESKKFEQMAFLAVIPREDIDMDEFNKDIESIVKRFDQHGIYIVVAIHPAEDFLSL